MEELVPIDWLGCLMPFDGPRKMKGQLQLVKCWAREGKTDHSVV
jgi:hypothetical protein